MFVDLCFSMSNWDLYSSISVLVCYCSTPCVSTISRLHVSSLAPVFYLNVSILVIPNEESTIFNRSSSASWVCQCHRLRHTTARPTAITSYRLLNFPCQVFVFLLSQTPPDPHLHPPHLLCTCPVHCVVLDQLHSGTFLLHTHVFSLTGSTSPPGPCSHYSSQCCLHHRTHEGPQSRVLMSSRPRSKSICPSYSSAHLCLAVSCTASVCAQYVQYHSTSLGVPSCAFSTSTQI